MDQESLYKQNANICRAAIALMREMTKVYGSEKGTKLSEQINEALGSDIKYQIFLGLITGSVGGTRITIIGLNSNNVNKISGIKALRQATNMGLKEAKDFLDQAYIVSSNPYAHIVYSGKELDIDCETEQLAQTLRVELENAGYLCR